MSLKIKICGITRLEDARFCAAAGADYLGFIQHPESPRYIAPEKAREIIEWCHVPSTVGVFVGAPLEGLHEAARTAGFTHIQLHGAEPPEYCAEVELPVIKAVRVLHDASSEQLRRLMEPFAEWVQGFLLDTHHTSLWGGTGESFNWRLARELTAEFPIFLAGGIHAGNVQQAVETMRPAGIDLSSGVESAPGVKDFDKLSAFFEAVRPFTHVEQP